MTQGGPRDPEVVRLGEHDITQAEETAATVELRIARVLAHPAWNPATLDNDLALVKLVSGLVFIVTTD